MVRLRQIILLLSVSSVCLGQNRCFYPNGKNATGDFPCDLSAENSACCGGGLGSVCLSNKLCRGPDGNLARGSCTDKNWQAPECALFCLGRERRGVGAAYLTSLTTATAKQARAPAVLILSPAPMSPVPTHLTAATGTGPIVATRAWRALMCCRPTRRCQQPGTRYRRASQSS
jgi:hypothetical protein